MNEKRFLKWEPKFSKLSGNFYLPESIRDLIIESLIWRDKNVFCNEISSKDFMIVDFDVDLSCPSDRWSMILSI